MSITDQLPGLSAISYTWPGTPGTLTPGQTVTATATYQLTQADINTGQVINQATATGTPPTGQNVTTPPATVPVPLTAGPKLTSTKTADFDAVQTPPVPGDTVVFHFSAKNEGNVTLTGVTITDAKAGLSPLVYTWPGTPGTLLPGETVTATATYKLTQADINTGHLANSATAKGTPPTGPDVTPPPSVTDTPLLANPDMTLVKTADRDQLNSPTKVGDQITYHFTAKNTGNVTLTNVSIADALPGLSALTYTWQNTPGTLQPDESVTATAIYSVTQADINAGHVDNRATTTGTPPTGPAVVPPPAVVDVPLTAGPQLTLTKGVDLVGLPTPPSAGDVITYRFSAQNTGNVTLTNVSISDVLPGLSALTYTWPGTPGTLTPGQTVTATATYRVTTNDINSGHVANVATAVGTPPSGPPVNSPPAPNDVTLTANPAIGLVKSASPNDAANFVVGRTITYTFVATNNGNVTLTNPQISETQFSGSGTLSPLSCPPTAQLQPRGQLVCTATYVLTQADIDAGHVLNEATASGTPPTGPDVVSPPAEVEIPGVQDPKLTLAKVAGTSGVSNPAKVGDVIVYTFTAHNDGNTTLTNVSITDQLPGLSPLTYTWPGTPGILLPGEDAVATAQYVLTQADINAGHVANSATSTGTPPNGPPLVTPPAETDTTLGPAPSIDLVKSADASAVQSPAVVGDTVTYTFVSTNNGNTTLTGVTIDDPLPGLSPLTYTWPGTPGTLDPGQQVTATATYQLTQSDINAGKVTNTATTEGTPPSGPPVTDQDIYDLTVTAGSGIELTKTPDAGAVQSPARLGDTVTYTFVSKNTGNTTLTGVTITDPMPGLSALTYTWPGAPGVLQPSQSVTATATYQLTQADLDAGRVDNTATTTGTPPTGGDVTDTATAQVPVTPGPSLKVTKAADTGALQNPVKVGDTITYTFSAENDGNVTLTGVKIDDVLPGLSPLTYTWLNTPGILAPKEIVTATATYQVTQADIDAGHVANAATATGNPPVGPPVVTPPAPTDTTLITTSELELTKVADPRAIQSPAQVGDTIIFTFVAKNNGNTTLTGVTINDPLPGLSTLTYTWPGAPGTLPPGQSVTATASYHLTQADIDRGLVSNTAIAVGTPPTGPSVTSPPASTDTPVVPGPKLTLTKVDDATAVKNPAQVGDTITYTFTAVNDGNTTLTGVTITDALPGLSSLTYSWPGTPGTLAPTEKVTATATYQLTQADINAGKVTNSATATGNPPTGGTVTTPPASVDTPLVSDPELTFAKDVVPGGIQSPAQPGDVVTFQFSAKNDGNVTLTGVTITDPKPGLSALTYTWPGTPGTLQPGETVTATATYALTQADIDAGHVGNVATSKGTPPSGPDVTPPPAATDTPLVATSKLTLTKDADATAVKNPAQVGDTITYLFAAENEGNTTLTGVVITDVLPGLSPLTYSWPGTPGTLLPGEKVTATATYQLTQADINAGIVTNSATATGTPPTGTDVTTPPATVDTPLVSDPELTFTKNVVPGGIQSPAQPGDVVTFQFSAKNDGNVTLTGVTITDPKPGLSPLTYTWPGTPGTLQPGETVTATATYALTQADIDAGHVANTATSTGTPPTGPDVTPPPATTDTPLVSSSVIELVKTADSTALSSPPRAGDQVTYTFVSKNTGNTTLTGVIITDALPGLSPLTYTWPGTPGTLQPGESVTATATYLLVQSDLNAGQVVNTATTVGTPPTGGNVTDDATETVPLPADPTLELVKDAQADAVQSPAAVGDTVTFVFLVTNAGNVTMTGVTIDDPKPGLSALTYSWPAAPGVLEPKQSASATATYQLTQADIDAGHVGNVATSTGTPPTGSDFTTPPAATDTPLVPSASIDLVKTKDTSALQSPPKAGDVVTYTFVSENTGNTTLTGVTIADPLPGLSPLTYTWPGTPGTLQPGEKVTATATYPLTQADLDAGTVVNTASTTGTPPSGDDVTDVASTTVPLASDPDLSLVKSTNVDAVTNPAQVGDTITYLFSAKNEGNTTLTGVAITDALPGLSPLTYAWPGAPGTLKPGETVTATATYQLTQADIDAGHVANSATAKGTPPTGTDVTTPPAVTDTPLVSTSKLTLTKDVQPGGIQNPAQVGDTITYLFSAKNEGTTTLTGVTIDDQLPGLSPLTYTWPGTPGTLLPDDVVTATATYQLTQADIDAGHVANTAISTGTPPTGTDVTTPPAVTDTPLVSTSKLTLTKDADATAVKSPAQVGDTITYLFTAENEGTTTLTGVTITDVLAGLSSLKYSWPGAAGTLLPGEKVTATATYQLTQADINAGLVTNSAIATGTPPTGTDVTTPPASVDTPLVSDPKLSLTKDAQAGAVQSPAKVGDLITFVFSATNDGNVTLTGVTIDDQMPGLSPLAYSWPGTPGTLQPKEVVTATATYQLTQADLDAGHVGNTATATGTPPTGTDVTTPPAVTDTPLTSGPSITLLKVANTTAIQSPAEVGDTITYTFESTNSGTVTLTDVKIIDQLPGLSALTYTWPGTPGTLAPKEKVVATATYQLTQADLDAGHVPNTATTVGTPPSGPDVTAEWSVDVPLTASPNLTLTKVADAAAVKDPAQVGDTITYLFSAENTGNTTLTGVTIADALPGLSPLTYTWPGTPGTLAPTQIVTATATYQLTQADINTGLVTNSATAKGTPPTGTDVTTPPASVDTPLVSNPVLTFTKDVQPDAIQSPAQPGDVVTFQFSAKNDGNVTLTGVTIDDPMPGLSPLTYTWPGTPGTLQPGETVTATATYALTQADIDAGHVGNVATSTGTPPSGPPVTPPPAATDTPLTSTPKLTLTKDADATAVKSPAQVGDTITYLFTAENEGTTTLTGVTITDVLPGLSPLTYSWPGTPGTLAPTEKVTATATYQLTQADINAGIVTNSATATGNPPTGTSVTTPPATVDTPLVSDPELTFTKDVQPGAIQSPAEPGDLVTFQFSAKNDGNVTLTNVSIDDPMPGLSPLTYVWPGTPGTLQPGETVTATATYALTQADIDAGHVGNVA
ncbi:DUF11 domain-containing protein, partial [Leifsonia sp. 109]|uniref:DUF11 domain-containing protein n=1 Tax=Leifsonia sp. 109 TaxID=1150399 RepID=UPI001E501E1A